MLLVNEENGYYPDAEKTAQFHDAIKNDAVSDEMLVEFRLMLNSNRVEKADFAAIVFMNTDPNCKSNLVALRRLALIVLERAEENNIDYGRHIYEKAEAMGIASAELVTKQVGQSKVMKCYVKIPGDNGFKAPESFDHGIATKMVKSRAVRSFLKAVMDNKLLEFSGANEPGLKNEERQKFQGHGKEYDEITARAGVVGTFVSELRRRKIPHKTTFGHSGDLNTCILEVFDQRVPGNRAAYVSIGAEGSVMLDDVYTQAARDLSEKLGISKILPETRKQPQVLPGHVAKVLIARNSPARLIHSGAQKYAIVKGLKDCAGYEVSVREGADCKITVKTPNNGPVYVGRSLAVSAAVAQEEAAAIVVEKLRAYVPAPAAVVDVKN